MDAQHVLVGMIRTVACPQRKIGQASSPLVSVDTADSITWSATLGLQLLCSVVANSNKHQKDSLRNSTAQAAACQSINLRPWDHHNHAHQDHLTHLMTQMVCGVSTCVEYEIRKQVCDHRIHTTKTTSLCYLASITRKQLSTWTAYELRPSMIAGCHYLVTFSLRTRT